MLSNSHILIVEDDPVASTTLAAYIGKEGYKVSTAPDGVTMRDLFARGDVDLILLDINLPDEDGFSLLREIRRQSEVGVIMVTGKGEDIDRIVALELGADDYVVKPFNFRLCPASGSRYTLWHHHRNRYCDRPRSKACCGAAAPPDQGWR
jgi:two-component system torCAD operon response regulator TorR